MSEADPLRLRADIGIAEHDLVYALADRPRRRAARSGVGGISLETAAGGYLAGDVRHERRRHHLPKITAFTSAPSQIGCLEELARHEPGPGPRGASFSTVPDLQRRRRQPAITLHAVRQAPALHFPGFDLTHCPAGSLETYPGPPAGPSWRASTSETPFSIARAPPRSHRGSRPVESCSSGAASQARGIARDAALQRLRTRGRQGRSRGGTPGRCHHGSSTADPLPRARSFASSRGEPRAPRCCPHRAALVHPCSFCSGVRGARVPAGAARGDVGCTICSGLQHVRSHRWLGRKDTTARAGADKE